MTRGSWIVTVVGVLLLAGGAAWTATQPMAFGWTAYTEVFPDWQPPTLRGLYVGMTTASVGLALVGGAVGYAIGRRRRSPAAGA